MNDARIGKSEPEKPEQLEIPGALSVTRSASGPIWRKPKR